MFITQVPDQSACAGYRHIMQCAEINSVNTAKWLGFLKPGYSCKDEQQCLSSLKLLPSQREKYSHTMIITENLILAAVPHSKFERGGVDGRGIDWEFKLAYANYYIYRLNKKIRCYCIAQGTIFNILWKIIMKGTSLEVQWLRHCLPMKWVRALVRELRPHMLQDVAKI